MASGKRLTGLARMRQRYTGEPFQLARAALEGGDNRHPIPAASGAQARLEAEILAKLGTGGQWWTHPLGMAHVRPTAVPTLIQLDSHTRFGGDTVYPRSSHVLDKLLPSAEVGVQVGGVVGLRVAGHAGTDLHLTLAEEGGHVVLRGVPGTTWEEILEARRRRCEEADCPALWHETSLTVHEKADIDNYRSVWDAERDLDWLGSALLRRIALFHTVSSAYSTRSWVSGDEWIFELDTVRGVMLAHNDLLGRLMDPVWGLPLRVDRYHCSCDPGEARRDDFYLRQCTYHLVHERLPLGGLQMRFRQGHAVYGDDARTILESLGSRRQWIHRVLPLTSPDVTRSPALSAPHSFKDRGPR